MAVAKRMYEAPGAPAPAAASDEAYPIAVSTESPAATAASSSKDEAVLRGFLDTHARKMPRTMLRYALEKLPPAVRTAYMAR